MTDTALPVTPYAGTSGHQGTTSQAAEPHRRNWQPKVRAVVLSAGSHGQTMREVCGVLNGTHQSVSAALSVLHKEGVLARLAQQRDNCGVYVINEPRFVQGRPTVEHRSTTRRKEVTREQIATEVDRWMKAPSEHETHLVDRIHTLINGK